MPSNSISRIRTLAKELAEGAADELWDVYVETYEQLVGDTTVFVPYSNNLKQYLIERWNNNYPNFLLLMSNDYLERSPGYFRVTDLAFQLIDEVEPSTIFISYRRKDSSAFALLVLKSLKSEGLDAFLDMSLEPGEEWHQGLKERIQQRDYFIVLIGKETLNSEVVRKEILWAMEAGSTIIPVWHNGFNSEWDGSPEIDKVLDRKHAIRVIEESTLAYNNAIVELLNRFGITP